MAQASSTKPSMSISSKVIADVSSSIDSAITPHSLSVEMTMENSYMQFVTEYPLVLAQEDIRREVSVTGCFADSGGPNLCDAGLVLAAHCLPIEFARKSDVINKEDGRERYRSTSDTVRDCI